MWDFVQGCIALLGAMLECYSFVKGCQMEEHGQAPPVTQEVNRNHTMHTKLQRKMHVILGVLKGITQFNLHISKHKVGLVSYDSSQ